MRLSGFTDTPITRTLLLLTLLTSLLTSLTDTKAHLPIHINPHLTSWHQYHRILTYQLAYQNSVEVLCACITIYELRVLERIWGSKKFLGFLVAVYVYVGVVVPAVVGLVLRPLSWGKYEYIPSGLTGVVFGLLACWRDVVPATYRYKIGLSEGVIDPFVWFRHSDSSSTGTASSSAAEGAGPSSSSSSSARSGGLTITLTSKSSSYFLPLQLAISQFPYSVVPAGVGWMVGMLLRSEVIPGANWRVPFYMSESRMKIDSVGVEALRRRIESDGIATASGFDQSDGTPGIAMGQQFIERTRVDR